MKRIRLLILEDSAMDAELLVRELETNGYVCDWTRADDEASFIDALCGNPDVILADYSLPAYSAPMALAALKQRRLNIPFIVVTGAVEEDQMVECLRSGATDYLLKDRLRRLPDAVTRALDDRRSQAGSEATERALVESDARFRRVAENAEDIIFRYRVAAPRRFEYVSPAATRMTGYTPEEHYRDPDLGLTIVHPEDKWALEQAIAGAAPLPSPLEVRWRHKDGRIIWTEQRVTAVRDEHGTLVAFEGIARDVTERKLAEREVRLAAQVLERVASLVLVADQEGNILYASPSVERLLGFSRADVLGQGWWRLSRGVEDDGEDERARLARAAAGSTAVMTEPYERMLVDSRGRQRWFEWRDEQGPGDTIVGVGQDVTERKLAEQEGRNLIGRLAASEAKYRALVEQMPAVTYAAGLEATGQTLYVSPQVERLLGARPEVFTGDSDAWTKRIHPDDRECVLEQVRSVQRHGGTRAIEYRMLHADGHAVWVRDEGALVRDRDGRPLCVQGVLIDVSERKAAEQALRDKEQALQTLIDASPLAIVELDTSRRVKVWNPAAERLFGWSAGEVLGQPNPILPPEHGEEYSSQCARAMAGERVAFETQRCRKDGALIDVLLSAAPIEDGDGRVTSMVALIADITDLKNAEALLREREEHFRSLIENALDMIAVVDGAGVITYLSPSAETVLGRPVAEAVGTSVFQWIHQEDLAATREMLAALAAGGTTQNAVTVRVRHADGTWRLVEAVARLSPHRNPAGPIIINARDVTERKNLEQQLRQAQKMEAIGQLAGGVAHDFNNLLTAILGYGQLLQSQLEPGSQLAADLEEIVRAGERAGELTRQLLAFSRRQVLKPQIVQLNTVVADFQNILRRVIGEHIELRTATDPALPLVSADPGQTQQVLLNLAVNARDAMARGGVLTIATRTLRAEAPLEDGHARLEPGVWACLTVSDTGIGMSPEIAARVFEPFFTTKGPGRGTGLGLATVYGIVSQSRGHIAVQTAPGAGTTFRIYLPEAEASTRPEPPARKDNAATSGTETILLAEDEPGIRKLIRLTLERQGYTVLEAANADEAMALSQRHTGTIDLLLSDIVMPGTSGVDLAQRLVATRPAIRVMHISGFAVAAHVGKLNPSVTFLQKPFTPDLLARHVRECLDRASDTGVAGR